MSTQAADPQEPATDAARDSDVDSDQDERHPLLLSRLADSVVRAGLADVGVVGTDGDGGPGIERFRRGRAEANSYLPPWRWLAIAGVTLVAGLLITALGVSVIDYIHRRAGGGVGPPDSGSRDGVANGYRLPEFVTPVGYRLHIEPDVPRLRYDGVVDIDVVVGEDSPDSPRRGVPTMELHAARTSIVVSSVRVVYDEASIDGGDNVDGTVPVDWFAHPDVPDVLVITPSAISTRQTLRIFPPGNYSLRIAFTGTIGDKSMMGFYRSDVAVSNTDATTHRGPPSQHWLAITNFEPSSARAAFPCFDEPGFKTPFVVSVTVREPWYVVSNSELDTIVDDPHTAIQQHPHRRQRRDTLTPKRTFVFYPTQPLSTYLVAWAVMTYVPTLKTIPSTGLVVRAWSTPEQSNATSFAFHIASKVIPIYESLFRMPLPLRKIDLVPVPDYVSEAMENWGLITFDANLFLVDSHGNDGCIRDGDQTDRWMDCGGNASGKLTTSLLIAHELAHYWFGDLVTLAWWDDLWLNEGFAELMQHVGIDAIYPSHDLLGAQFFTAEHVPALYSDASSFTDPVRVRVDGSADAPAAFSDIVYNKGASVLRMVMHTFNSLVNATTSTSATASGSLASSPVFGGLSRYLHDHVYGTATTQDLWTALDATLHEMGVTSHIPFSDMFTPWVERPGFPLIQVDMVTEYPKNMTLTTYSSNRRIRQSYLVLRQSRFTLDGAAFVSDPWPIMVSIRFAYPRITNKTSTVLDTPQWHMIDTTVIMTEPILRVDVPIIDSEHVDSDGVPVVMVNTDRIGLYRVQYNGDMLDRLCEAIRDGLVSESVSFGRPRASRYNQISSVADRAGIVSDLTTLMLSHRMRVPNGTVVKPTALSTYMSFLYQEPSPWVWRASLVSMTDLHACPSLWAGGGGTVDATMAETWRSWSSVLVDDMVDRGGVAWTQQYGRSSAGGIDPWALDIVRDDILFAAIRFGSPQAISKGCTAFENLTVSWTLADHGGGSGHIVIPATAPYGMSDRDVQRVVCVGVATAESDTVFDQWFDAVDRVSGEPAILTKDDPTFSYGLWVAVIHGLACTSKPSQLDRLLSRGLDAMAPSEWTAPLWPRMRAQDAMEMYRQVVAMGGMRGHGGVTDAGMGARMVWTWLRSRWRGLASHMGTTHAFVNMVASAASGVRDRHMLIDVSLAAGLIGDIDDDVACHGDLGSAVDVGSMDPDLQMRAGLRMMAAASRSGLERTRVCVCG